MIEFTGQDGQKVAVNPTAVWHVRQASGDQTAIYAMTGTALFVLESYPDVLEAFRQHGSGQGREEQRHG